MSQLDEPICIVHIYKFFTSQSVLLLLQELLREPVIAADGYTYERHAFQQWLKQHSESPVTGRPLQIIAMLPNFAIMAVVESNSLFSDCYK